MSTSRDFLRLRPCVLRDSLEACSHGDIGTVELFPRSADARDVVENRLLLRYDGAKLLLVDAVVDASLFRLHMHQFAATGSAGGAVGGSRKHAVVSLQVVDTGCFLSPTSLSKGATGEFGGWTARAHCEAWEQLEVLQHGNGALSFRSVGAGGEACGYMSAGEPAAGAEVIRRDAPEAWESFLFRHARVPVIDISPLINGAVMLRATERALFGPSEELAFVENLLELPPTARAVVLRIGKAARDLGFYHVVGHGMSVDILALAKVRAAELPPRGDDSLKDIVKVYRDSVAMGGAVPPAPDTLLSPALPASLCSPAASCGASSGAPLDPCPPSRYYASRVTPLGVSQVFPIGMPEGVVASYAMGCVSVEKQLLHALALLQAAVEGAPPPTFRALAAPRPIAAERTLASASAGECAKLPPPLLLQASHVLPLGTGTAVRVLRYPPGKRGSLCMCRHRDATWLTLLLQDDVGGLFVTVDEGGRRLLEVAPVAGALLVNAGACLQEFSGGFYEAVRHQVERVVEGHTRVSVVFFCDAADGVARTLPG